MTFDDAALLGVFAFTFRIPALSNQVTDLIRQSLANGAWALQASIVDHVYAATATAERSPLRDLIREALGQLPRATVESADEERESWKAVFLNHAKLGWDYIEAGGKTWSKDAFLEGTCRFHDHEHEAPMEEDKKLEVEAAGQCPYKKDECFPMDEEQKRRDMLEKITGKEWQAPAKPVEHAIKVPEETVTHGSQPNGIVQAPSIKGEAQPGVPTTEPVADIAPVKTTTTLPEEVKDQVHVNGFEPKADQEGLIKAPISPAKELSALDPVDDEVSGKLTFKSMIDRMNGPKNTISTVEEAHTTEPAAINGITVVDSESLPDEGDGALASDATRDELQMNGDKAHVLGMNGTNGAGADNLVEEGATGLKKKNKKKKKGSMSAVQSNGAGI